jgi:hypothetical protein
MRGAMAIVRYALIAPKPPDDTKSTAVPSNKIIEYAVAARLLAMKLYNNAKHPNHGTRAIC